MRRPHEHEQLDCRRFRRARPHRPRPRLHAGVPRQGGTAASPLARRPRRLLLADRSHGRQARLQAFTAIGVVAPGLPYEADMGGDVRTFRKDVCWSEAIEAPVRPLLGSLSFARDNRSWGYQLRFGLFRIEDEDMRVIASAMRATLPALIQEAATR